MPLSQKRRTFMKTKKLLAAVLATMLVLTAALFVACNNTDDMSKNIYAGNYTTVADEKAVEQLQSDVQKLATDSVDQDGKPVALGYRLAITVKGSTKTDATEVKVDGKIEGLLTTDEKQNVSAQLSATLNASTKNAETNEEEAIAFTGNAWVLSETNKAYADIDFQMGGTKVSGKYCFDLKELLGKAGVEVTPEDVDIDEMMNQFKSLLADSNTKIYVDGDNKYKIEATLKEANVTAFLFKTNDGKICFKLTSTAYGVQVSVDLRPTQDKVKLPEKTDEYGKFERKLPF